MWKKQLWGLLLATGLLAACNAEETVAPVEDEEQEPEEEVTEPEDNNQDEDKEVTFSYHYPLTGIGSETEILGRPVAVMINNHPKARPQTGIHKADVVYEILAEGSVTRFLAIYQSELPEKVGPVRSARDYFIELSKGYNSLYIAHGFSPEAKQMLNNGYVDNINGIYYDGTLFKRADFRYAPHNSYITFENIQKGAENKGYELETPPTSLPFMTETEESQLSGQPANHLMISYFSDAFNVIYEYDPNLDQYTRYSDGVQTADYETDEPVLLDNIFIIETTHEIIDNAGRRTIDFQSGGKGYLIQKGQWQEVEWQNVDGRILPYKNGKPVKLVQGRTWINVIPNNPGLEASVAFESTPSE